MATYNLKLVCPRCNKQSEHSSDTRKNPRVKCGDCLFNYTEVVEMKIVAVDVECSPDEAVRLAHPN